MGQPTDHDMLTRIDTTVTFIREQLEKGSRVIQNHENAIRTLQQYCVQKADCTRRHESMLKIVWGIVVLIVTSIFSAIGLWLRAK